MAIDKQETLKLLEELVAIDSVNPMLVPATHQGGQAAGRPNAPGEQRASEHVRDFLRANGIAAELEDAAPGRPNVVATIGPANVKPALMIVAHIDTVGAGDMREPFTPRVRDGKMYGRGALDIKSGVAAMCAAAAARYDCGRRRRGMQLHRHRSAVAPRAHGGSRDCAGADGFEARRRAQRLRV